jgi:hypothetical protein
MPRMYRRATPEHLGDPMQRAIILIMLCLLAVPIACTTDKRTGPPFQALTEPSPGDTLTYIFRTDSLKGIGASDVKLDGEKLGKMKNGEFLAFLLDPGPHELRVRLRWLNLIPRSWTRLAFEARPGETLFLRTWAAYEHVPGMGDLNAPGRANENAAVVIFAAPWTRDEAMIELGQTRRARGH